MDVPKDRLGLDGDDMIDVIDVKSRPAIVEELKQKPGFLPAYHMDKKHWITILLDGSVPKKDIIRLIDESYELVGICREILRNGWLSIGRRRPLSPSR